jgi:hypothetical protein
VSIINVEKYVLRNLPWESGFFSAAEAALGCLNHRAGQHVKINTPNRERYQKFPQQSKQLS